MSLAFRNCKNQGEAVELTNQAQDMQDHLKRKFGDVGCVERILLVCETQLQRIEKMSFAQHLIRRRKDKKLAILLSFEFWNDENEIKFLSSSDSPQSKCAANDRCEKIQRQPALRPAQIDQFRNHSNGSCASKCSTRFHESFRDPVRDLSLAKRRSSTAGWRTSVASAAAARRRTGETEVSFSNFNENRRRETQT